MAAVLIGWLLRRTSTLTFRHFEEALGRRVPVYEIGGGFAFWWVTTWSVTGFAVGGSIYTLSPSGRRHLIHELTHIEQAMTVRFFALRYVLEFLFNLARMPTHPRNAYLAISYEVEARERAMAAKL